MTIKMVDMTVGDYSLDSQEVSTVCKEVDYYLFFFHSTRSAACCEYDGIHTVCRPNAFRGQVWSESYIKIRSFGVSLQWEIAFAALVTQIGRKIIVNSTQITVHRSPEAYWPLGSCHCPLQYLTQPRSPWCKDCHPGTMRNVRHCEDKASL